MSANPPPEVAALLGNLFGKAGGVAQMTLYNLLQAMIAEALAPFLDTVRQLAYSKDPTVPLSPETLADGVNRGYYDQASAAAQALLSGVNPERFGQLVAQAGEAPGPSDVARAYRLGVIPEDSGDPNQPGYKQGIEQGRIRNIWAPVMEAIARAYPTPDLLVQADLRGQIDTTAAQSQYEQLGGVPAYYQLQFDVAGRPPSPAEVARLVHRGIVPKLGVGADKTTFEQAVRESDLKDKWLEPLWQLSTYLPPPRTVVALLREGSLSDAEGLALLQESGLSADLAAAYVTSAHTTRTAAHRELARADIEALYVARVISQADATAMLADLGYSAEDSAFVLEMDDVHELLSNLNSAVNKYRSLYLAHKMERNAVSTALDSLGVAPGQRDKLLAFWDGEREATIRELTAAEVRTAMTKQVISQQDALTRLTDMGYTAEDAQIFLAS